MGFGQSKEQQTSAIVEKVLRDHAPSCEWANKNDIVDLPSLQKALKNEGLESSEIIFAIDLTKSNDTQVFGVIHLS